MPSRTPGRTSPPIGSRWHLLAAIVAFAALCATQAADPRPATCIDLSKHFTAKLTDSVNSPAFVLENNLASLPKGRQVFSDVPFEVGGLVQLSGLKLREWGREEFPEAAKEIKVQLRCRRLHVLHGAGGVFDHDGVTIAKLVLHYGDGSQRELEVQNGVHVRDWWGDPKQAITGTNSVLTWTGSNPALIKYSRGTPGSLRLYKSTFENPQPEITVTTIDYVSAMQNSSPFLIGLTLD